MSNSTGTVGSSIAFMLGLLGLLWAMSNPALAVVAVATVVLAAMGLRRGLTALARSMHGHITRLDVPGFGTVELRVTPR